MCPTKSMHQQSLQTQIHMAFQGPLLNCFEEIDRIVTSYQPKDLVHALPQILEMFFNFDGSLADEMNFGRLTSNQAYEFEMTRHFFGLESNLFSLIVKISTDPNCFTLFEFPFACLPLATRNSILLGRHPTFYASKLKFVGSSSSPDAVYLDAFDLYMFHFAYYVVNPHNWKIMHLIKEPSYRSEWIYSAIFNNFLNAFFPASPDALPVRMTKLRPAPIARSFRSEAAGNQSSDVYRMLDGNVGYSSGPGQNHTLDGAFNQSQLSSFQQSLNTSGQAPNQFRPQFGPTQSLSPSRLLSSAPAASSPGSFGLPSPRAGSVQRVSKLINIDPQLLSQLNNSKLDSMTNEASTTANNNGRMGDLFSCSDAILQIFVDFWLNQFDSSVLEQNVWLTNKMLKVEDFLLLVRVLVKHLHLFANTAAEDPKFSQTAGSTAPYFRNIASSQQHLQNLRTGMTQEQREWNEFKRGVWSTWLCSKLYNFLKYHFTYGPIERPLVEIWLSFIQPWRYMASMQQQQEDRVDSPQQHEGERFVEHKWVPFMRRHLFFYTSFLQLILERFLTTDFTSSTSSLILARVAKVFSIRGLRDVIQEVEMSLQSGTLNLGGSGFVKGMHPANQRVLTKELEGDEFQFRPLFSHETKAKATKLIANILVAKESLESQLTAIRLEVSRRSWFQSISSFFSSDDDSAFAISVQKNVDQLAVSANQLLIFFEISVNELPRLPVTTWSKRSPGMRTLSTGVARNGHVTPSTRVRDNLPDIELKEDGSFALTPLGRHEILTKKKKFDLEYVGDLDSQPIRSWEFAPLVVFFQKLCGNINGKYSREILRATEKPGLSGAIARHLFQRPRFNSGPLVEPGSSSTPPRNKAIGFTTPRRRTNRFVTGSGPDSPMNSKLILSPNGILTNNPSGTAPRLSLRFLARYSTLSFVFFSLLLVKIWFGMDLTSVFVLFGIVVVACVTLASRIVLSCSQETDTSPVRRTLFADSQSSPASLN